MRATVAVPGSCGELVQGVVDGGHFLVTCPISWFAQATVWVESRAGVFGPSDRPKALRAARMVLERLGGACGLRVRLRSPLPLGKGMASSTADIAATAAAAARALGKELSPGELASLALGIEPTDGVFFPGIVLFDHLTGRRLEFLGPAPALKVLIVDPGGEVETISFNRRPELYRLNLAKEAEVRKALRLVREGMAEGDVVKVAKGATLSALANQAILPKPELDTVLDIAVSCGALGVNVAHSGTVMGVLYRDGEADPEELKTKVLERFPYVRFSCAGLVDGGVYPVASESADSEGGASPDRKRDLRKASRSSLVLGGSR